ncbi:histamine N-methyltransferase-like [Lytechinus variegatus]|uniref:histamine N-methyltransferase-like n=1 Tax=Lytechinus variegatus TaxID=7654 RepID=UPI001BB1155F|nr:histamine N-methyltransferase-like [Lytechinus variegatus]XP_041478600.1 histamine N-methyltransferase-like [Lytechinus variegatus]
MGTQLPSSIPGLRDFVSDSERFQDVFETAFLPNNDGVPKLERWFEKDFEQEVVVKMTKSFPTDEELRLLGIGTGNGRTDIMMLEKFLRHFPKIHYTVVEPDQPAFQEFKDTVEKSSNLSNVSFDWQNTTIEGYWKNSEDSQEFDFISMVHTAYYLEDVGMTMDRLLASLTVGGASLFVHKSGENKTSEFAHQLPWISKPSHMSPGRRILDAARRANQRRLRVTPFPAVIDITSVFDAASDVGPKLMDFLTQGAHFCQTASEDVLKATMDILRSLTTKSDDGERVLISNDFEIIEIWKDPSS